MADKETYASVIFNRTELRFLMVMTWLIKTAKKEKANTELSGSLLKKFETALRALNPLPTLELKAETITDGEANERKSDKRVLGEPLRRSA